MPNELQILFRYIDKYGIFDRYSAHGHDFSDKRAPNPPADHSDPSFATTLAHGLDVLAAFRNQQRRALERRTRRAHRPVAADGVAADLHAGAARLSQARRQGPLRTRARRARNRLSAAVGDQGAADGASPDARLRGLRRRHGFDRDAVRARLHLCRDAAHHRRGAASARRRLLRRRWRPTAVGRALLSLYTKDELDAYVQAGEDGASRTKPTMSSGARCRTSSSARSAALRSRSANGGARSSASPRRSIARPAATACRSIAAFPRSASAPSRSSANAGRASWGLRAASARWSPTNNTARSSAEASRTSRMCRWEEESCAGEPP